MIVLPAGHGERLVGEPLEVCSRRPMPQGKMDGYIKLSQRLRDHGLGRAATTLHALVFDRSYTLPTLPWLQVGWRVDRADRGDSTSLPLLGACLQGALKRTLAGGVATMVEDHCWGCSLGR